MKKIISILACIAIIAGCVFSVAGCAKKDSQKAQLVLITDGDTIKDDGYNQSAWEGLTAYGDENNMTYGYYQPALDENGELTVDTIAKYIELAVNNSAEYIVLPGESFAVSAYETAQLYPDVNFILIDAYPHAQGDTVMHTVPNVMSVKFAADQAGFLAGYLAVIRGNTELGYFGEYNSKNSTAYGAGFVQGADYASQELGIPVTVDWAEYDSPFLDYDYSFTVTACYVEAGEDDHKVVVENGQGSGTYAKGSNVAIVADPAPEGQTFDHWEVKSDTEGVKDKKINVSAKDKSEMNLIIEDADCTITAVYKDIDSTYYAVKVMGTDGTTQYSVQSVSENGKCWVEAPPAEPNMVFDHWESTVPDAVEKPDEKGTNVNVTSSEVILTPVYVISDVPTFNITVETGEGGSGESTGDGAFLTGDKVTISAAVPQDGYKFSNWKTSDIYGYSANVAMENEYHANTSFEMVDRYASIVENMFDKGITTVFTGGNSKVDSAFTAKGSFDYDLNIIAAGEKTKDSYSTIVSNYGEAVKDCLSEFAGGTIVQQDCSTDGFWATFVAGNTEAGDKATDEQKAEAAAEKVIQDKFDAVYKALAEGSLTVPVNVQADHAGYEFCTAYPQLTQSNLITLNGEFRTDVITVNPNE